MLGYHLKKNVKPIVKHPFFAFIVFGLALILLQILSWTAGFPKSSAMSGIATVLIYSIVGFGFTYLLGYAGLASLGTAGFTGLGAYIVGYFLRETGVPYIVTILVVLAVSIILGVAVGFISLRIEGIFLAIVTLGLSEILYQIFTNWIGFTGGPNGSSASIPIFQKWFGLSTTTSKRAMFIVLVVVVVFLMIITFNLCKSSTGRAMLAMKNSTSAAQAMGISLLRYRLLAFVLSTVYAGIGGIMFMSYLGYASPTNWTLMFSLNLLAAVIIGGTRSLWGTIVGCFIVFGLTPIFFQDIAFLRDNSWFMYALIGVLIILIIMFYQGGLVQLVRDIKNGIKKARAKRRLYRYGEEE